MWQICKVCILRSWYYGVASQALLCHSDFPFEHWFLDHLLHFLFSFLLIAWKKQQKEFQGLEPCEAWPLDPDFGLVQLRLLQPSSE